MFYKTKETKIAEKEYISKQKRVSKPNKRNERYSMYLQQKQTSYSAAQPQPVLAGGAPC
jgi:hypothetical protein